MSASSSPCPFCSLAPERIVAEEEHCLAIRDSFPLCEGHTLIIPRAHAASLYALSKEVQANVWRLAGQMRDELAASLSPDGFTIGLNDGAAAGQTVAHAHVHVIPRWANDVDDPRGGVRWVIPKKAKYWEGASDVERHAEGKGEGV